MAVKLLPIVFFTDKYIENVAEKLIEKVSLISEIEISDLVVISNDDTKVDRRAILGNVQIHSVLKNKDENMAQVLNRIKSEFPQLLNCDVLVTNDRDTFTSESLSGMLALLHGNFQHGLVFARKDLTSDTEQGIYQVVPLLRSRTFLVDQFIVENFWKFNEDYNNDPYALEDLSLSVNQYGFSTLSLDVSESNIHNLETKRDERDFELIQKRYPFYSKITSDLANYGLLPIHKNATGPENNKKSFLFCLHYLTSKMNGTSVYALKLFKNFYQLYKEKYDIYLLMDREQVEFFELEEDYGHLIVSPKMLEESNEIYDLSLLPRQLDSLQDLLIAIKHSKQFMISILDIISIRSLYINFNEGLFQQNQLFLISLLLADKILTISDNTKKDILDFVPSLGSLGDRIEVVRLASSLAEESVEAYDFENINEYILVIGNDFKHKMLYEVFSEVKDKNPTQNFVFLGLNIDEEEKSQHANFRFIDSGQISDIELKQIITGSKLVIFPSIYEGFGLPVIDALSLGKPVIVAETPVNNELAQMSKEQYSQMITTFRRIKDIPECIEIAGRSSKLEVNSIDSTSQRTWRDVAKETEEIVQNLLSSPLDLERSAFRHSVIDLVSYLSDKKLSQNEQLVKILTEQQSGSTLGLLKRKFSNSVNLKNIEGVRELIKDLPDTKPNDDPLHFLSLDECEIVDDHLRLKGWSFHYFGYNLKGGITDGKDFFVPIDIHKKRIDVLKHFNGNIYAYRSGFESVIPLNESVDKSELRFITWSESSVRVSEILRK